MTLYVICQAFSCAQTIDLGTHGPLFKVEEENMIVHLKNKLQKLAQEGKLDDLENQWKERITQKLKKPEAVQGVFKTKEARSWRHDPTLIIGHDIKAAGGETLAKKGDKINPLHTLKPEKGFLFIDGEDEDHVQFAKKYLDQFDVVLVKGSPFEVQDQLKAAIFFDQGGYLTNHYGITHVPALLSVQGDHLFIEEVICEKP
ncbi:MAG: hypothetical protein Q8K36_07305 [Alphaproteobacteria bacterium]|nr:hypothetical protein [Alphaproteobacteria bacterium]